MQDEAGKGMMIWGENSGKKNSLLMSVDWSFNFCGDRKSFELDLEKFLVGPA